MKNKKILILSILILLIAIVTGVSITYALWQSKHVTNPNIISSTCLRIDYDELSGPITLNRTSPGSFTIYDEDNNNHNDYYFKVTNTCESNVEYNINLETLEETDINKEYLMVLFYGFEDTDNTINNYEDIINILKSNNSQNVRPIANIETTLDKFENTNTTLDNALYSNKLVSVKINPHETHAYSLLMGLNFALNNNENVINKTWKGKITINAEPEGAKAKKAILKENAFYSLEQYKDKAIHIKEYKEDVGLIRESTNGAVITDDLYNAIDLSDESSDYKIYAWYNEEEKTIYYYSESDKIYMQNDKFEGFEYVEDIDLTSIDTSMMTSMNSMFKGCYELTSLDLSNFDTSNVTDMHAMFSECFRVAELNISSFTTSKVVDISEMFESCDNLASLDLSHFDTSSLTNVYHMIYWTGIEDINLSSFQNYKNEDYEMVCRTHCPDKYRGSVPSNIIGYTPSENAYCNMQGVAC